MKPQLSIVMPVFNEAENIKLLVERFAQLPSSISTELIFVEDGGSKDDTRAVLGSLCEKHPFVIAHFTDKPGYGASIWEGLKVARADIVGWTHADLQTDIKDIFVGYKLLMSSQQVECTFVKGKRVKRKIADTIFTFGMSLIASLILRKVLFDINAQPKIFHRSFLEKLPSPPADFSFDLYAFYLAKKNGYKIKTFPVEFIPRIHGESKWAFNFSSKWKTIMRTIKYIFRLRKLV